MIHAPSHPVRRFGPRAWIPRQSAFTLIEMLVVISLIAVLLALLLPALRSAREQGKVVRCLANLRGIAQATLMYIESEKRAVLPFYQIPPHAAYAGQVELYTPLVFGGYRSTRPSPDGLVIDASLYPAQLRPLNAFVDPTASASLAPADRGRDVIKLYQCPGDRTYSTSVIGAEPVDVLDEPLASHEANGSSYCLNSRFMQGYAGGNGTFLIEDSPAYSLRLAESGAFVGGKASRFILWMEQGFYSAAYRAEPTLPNGAAPQREGWHRRFSAWAAGFADGRAEYGYYDTRLVFGLGGTIWQP
ncbi:MAG: hypothetical protein HBSAPP02_08900 [Phycisphaerae bacterium]|nr:MAG: hypothetical protein DCC66_00960 [Planctomycetota bacterium]GJQ25858.1 MAG: hypothetical protein HBSAPP02_08900 [Phycisphaerae bacterium]